MLNRLVIAATVALLPVSAFAQTAPAAPAATEKSSEQMVCEMSGDCGQAQTAEQDRPESRGFSIARRTAAAAPVAAPARPVALANHAPARMPVVEAGKARHTRPVARRH